MDFDEVLELCGDGRRRIVLATLEAHRQSLTMDDLAAAVAEHDQHEPPPDVSGETLARIKITLHHSHVPKLEDAGLVRYDHERELVEPTEQFDRVEPHLSAILDAAPEVATALEP